MGGPNLLLGMKFTSGKTVVIDAIEVMTGKRPGQNTVAIWDHDSARNKPKAIMGSKGIWTMQTMVSWQGAKLPRPVVLRANTSYWMVWGMPSAAQASMSTDKNGTIRYRGSFDNGTTWNGQNNGQNPWPARAWKFRLYCAQTSGSVTVFGKGKPGSGNIVPSVAITGWPVVGNELQLVLSNAAPQAPAVLVLGNRITLPISLGTIYAMPLITVVLQTSTGRTPGTGGIVVPLRIPDQPVFVGLKLTLQWWIVDTAANQGLAHTQGAEFITK